MIQVEPGTVPFRLLALLGRAAQALPGFARWQPAPVPPGAPAGARRLVYFARGEEDGAPVRVDLVAHIVDETVVAIAVATPRYLGYVAEAGADDPHLSLAPRPPEGDPRLLHWIAKTPEGIVNAGLAF